MQGKFNFVGELQFNKEESKNSWLRTGKTKSGEAYQTLGAAVVPEKNNRSYVELFGMKQKNIQTFDKDWNKITVSWEDRFDEDVVKNVGKLNVINDGERHAFITSWDFIEYVKDNKEKFEGTKVRITGQINKNIYKGVVKDRFQIGNIYFVDEETKPGLTITEELLYTKDSIDLGDWKSEKKIFINGYVETYIDKENGNKLVPRQLVFDCSKIDFEKENHVKILKYKLKQMGLKLDGTSVVNVLKENKTYKLIFICNYVNGNEIVEFDESMLTENQRDSIAIGLKTIDDFRPKGSMYGERITLCKIKDFDLTGDYSDGYVDAKISPTELMDMVYFAQIEESVDDILDKEDNTKGMSNVDEEDDDLFS